MQLPGRRVIMIFLQSSLVRMAVCLATVVAARGGVPPAPTDVLSLSGGRLQLDGAPFAEISFNKFDLFWALHDELRADRALTPDNPVVKS